MRVLPSFVRYFQYIHGMHAESNVEDDKSEASKSDKQIVAKNKVIVDFGLFKNDLGNCTGIELM